MVKQTSLLMTAYAVCSLLFASCSAEKLSFRLEKKSHQLSHVFVDYALDADDAIFKDSLNFSIADPKLKISAWENELPAKPVYAPSFKTTKQSYTGSGSFKVIVENSNSNSPVNAPLYVHYQRKNNTQPEEANYTIQFDKKPTSTTTQQSTNTPVNQHKEIGSLYHSVTQFVQKLLDIISAQVITTKTIVSDLVSKTESKAVQLFFVFILGLLMSLTPCIYPMIPVTVGILQTTASNSLARNFLLALSYTIGIAMTFATLGLLAASGSAHFGALMGNPYFVCFLVFFLGYLAFSMLGFYDMYTPKFLQPDAGGSADGSFASAFIFGAISGSVASPCISPGLLLLLSIVATMGSKLLGFIYLFVFGFGLGVPLLIIGTFSGSMKIMPRAGLWMVEVKKLFGFMLLSMCFFYLNNILPWYLLLWGIGFTTLFIGVVYLSTIEAYHSKGMRWFKQITGTGLICISFLVFFQAYKAMVNTDQTALLMHWNTNYHEVRERAQKEQKMMLVDFGASWCSSCNEIEHRLLHNPLVQKELDTIAMVKIDCTNPHAESCAAIQKTYNIIGFPAILLVDPSTEKVLARWGGELLDISPEEFITLIKAYNS
jgi:thiol:disulfide interchange protein DsbD